MARVNIREEGAQKTVRVLVVSGFVVDTYSEIERSYVELCASSDTGIDYLWLVPEISFKHNRFAIPESRKSLKEPVWAPYLRRNNISCVTGNISRYNVVSNFLLFRRIFRADRIDAVYVHFGFERFWAAFLGKLWGKVTIWNEHWNSLGTRYTLAKKLFYRLFVDEFISVSNFITSTLPANARVHTIHNAVRTEALEHLRGNQISAFRRQLGIAEDVKIVLMVAQFTPQKRHDLALEICQKVFQARSDVFFVFLGDGTTRLPFLKKAGELGLQDKITSPGYVNDVDRYYAIADLSMLTSHKEGFGYAVLEAMEYGLPVVAFDTGGPAEVIRHGETGFLVKDGDVSEFTQRLLDLADSKELRTTIGQKARYAVEQDFSRESWTKRLNTTLRDIVTECRR